MLERQATQSFLHEVVTICSMLIIFCEVLTFWRGSREFSITTIEFKTYIFPNTIPQKSCKQEMIVRDLGLMHKQYQSGKKTINNYVKVMLIDFWMTQLSSLNIKKLRTHTEYNTSPTVKVTNGLNHLKIIRSYKLLELNNRAFHLFGFSFI